MGSTGRDATSGVAGERCRFAPERLVIPRRVLRLAASLGSGLLSALSVLRAGASCHRSGWDMRYILTLLLSIVGVAFWCATTYFIIHHVTNAAS